MAAKITAIFCVFAAITELGVSGYPQTNGILATDKAPSYVKMLHLLLHRLGFMPDGPDHNISTTEGPDAHLSNSTTTDDTFYAESIHKSFQLALESLPSQPRKHHIHHQPPMLSPENHHLSLGFGPLHLANDHTHENHENKVQFNAHSGRSPVTFERNGNGLSIHLNTKINFGKPNVFQRLIEHNFGPFVLNNNIEFQFGPEEKEELKPEVVKPIEPDYIYETYSDDEDYYDGSGEGSGTSPKITKDDIEGSGFATTIEPTVTVDADTTFI